MVDQFAREWSGSAELQSRLGVGTIVTIRLPGLLRSVHAAEEVI